MRTARRAIRSGESVDPLNVTDRDHTVKSAIFALSVTVRAKWPDRFNRPHTSPACRSTISRHSRRSVRSCSKVSSTEMDLAILSPCQGEQARPGGLTQLVHQLRPTGGPDVTDGAKPECLQTFCGHRSDAGNGPCR